MTTVNRNNQSMCKRSSPDLLEAFSIAFQPIVDCEKQETIGYEALVRGLHNENAQSVLDSVQDKDRYEFDHHCRVKAINDATKIGLQGMYLSVNILPNSISDSCRCLLATLRAARKAGLPTKNLILEFSELEEMANATEIQQAIERCRSAGFRTAIDDFGAGYAGLGLLVDFRANIVKLDMKLIRGIDRDRVRQAILVNSLNLLNQLNIDVIAEGVESKDEMSWLRRAGVRFMQGFYFAMPAVGQLPTVAKSRFYC